MKNKPYIRLASLADAAACLNVYAPYVLHTSVTFEYEVPTLEEYQRRMQAILPEYQWSAESTIYLSKQVHGMGIARRLYEALFKILILQGHVNIYAGVLSSNTNSTAFHRALGFEEIGLFRNIGYKLGEWHSNMWYQKHLAEYPANPAPPMHFNTLPKSAIDSIIANMNSHTEMP